MAEESGGVAAEPELWLPVECSPLYEVSNLGNVRRAVRAPGTHAVRSLKPIKGPQGYPRVCVKVDGVFRAKVIHGLVCRAFHGPRPTARHQVAHNDGTKDNNRADNLRWALPEENQADRIIHGTDIRGEAVHKAVLREQDIPIIRRLRMQHVPLGVIARAFGVSESTISLVALGKIWRHAA